nr:MAG TPA: hypothetical protein [Caudoviricetes sp.]
MVSSRYIATIREDGIAARVVSSFESPLLMVCKINRSG